MIKFDVKLIMAYDPSYNGLASGQKTGLRLTKKQVENNVEKATSSVSKVTTPISPSSTSVSKVTTQNPPSNTPAPRAYA